MCEGSSGGELVGVFMFFNYFDIVQTSLSVKKDRCEVYEALIEFAKSGKVPVFSKEKTKKVFDIILPLIKTQRRKDLKKLKEGKTIAKTESKKSVRAGRKSGNGSAENPPQNFKRVVDVRADLNKINNGVTICGVDYESEGESCCLDRMASKGGGELSIACEVGFESEVKSCSLEDNRREGGGELTVATSGNCEAVIEMVNGFEFLENNQERVVNNKKNNSKERERKKKEKEKFESERELVSKRKGKYSAGLLSKKSENLKKIIDEDEVSTKDGGDLVCPTIEELQSFIDEKKLEVVAGVFYHFYNGKNWKINGKAFDWREKLLEWECRKAGRASENNLRFLPNAKTSIGESVRVSSTGRIKLMNERDFIPPEIDNSDLDEFIGEI